MNKLKIFCVVDSNFKKNSKSYGFELMFESALEKKLPFQIVVNNSRSDGSYYSKIIPIIKFLESCNDDELIMYVDAFDTLFLDGEDDILRKFELTNSKFLISGEINCYPFDSLHDLILEKTKRFINDGIYKIEPENKYLFRNPCAGMMMGYKPYFLTKMYKWKNIIENNLKSDSFPISNVVSKEIYSKSDQGTCQIDYVKSENDFMSVDVYPRVFLNHHFVMPSVFYLNNGKVEYQSVLSSKQEFPSVIHFNGSWYDHIFNFIQALNLSKNKVLIKLENNILKLQINQKIKNPIGFKIYNQFNKLEYEIMFSDNEPDLIRNISSESINKNLKFKVELSYQGYTFHKQIF